MFHCRNLFQNGANGISEMDSMVNDFLSKSSNFCNLDHPILFKFCQLVVNIVTKELQIVFLTYAVSNNNGNMEELEHEISMKS